MIANLTPARTRELPAPESGNVIHYDTEARGLGLRITQNNARSWIFNYRIKGVERRLTIGSLADWPPKLARDEARRLRRLVDQGHDPMAERHAERAAPTMRDLVERWRTDRAPSMRSRSRVEYESLLRQWIDPELGNHKVADITHDDIDRLHRKVTKTGTSVRANRLMTLLSRLFNLAVVWKLRTDNPVKGIEKNSEEKRQRYLKTKDELPRLVAALEIEAETNRQVADIVRLLLMTGARKSEVLTMKWDDVDLGEPPVWVKPASATKQAKIHHVPLSPEVRDILVRIKTAATGKVVSLSPFVFPARNEFGRVRDIKRGWNRICRRAGLSNLRIHDLRHSYASILVSQGHTLPMIGALLGHSQPATTARYAHLFDDAQRAATEQVSAIFRKNGPKGHSDGKTGEVVGFAERKP